MDRRLEIGPGVNPISAESEFEWETIGFEAQWGLQRLVFPDNVFTEVYASHVLEHVPWMHTVFALQEARRILKPGGVVEIWVPDFAKILQSYEAKQPGDRWRRFNPEGDFMKWVNGRLFTYGPDETNWHHACFDAAYLKQCLAKAGFRHVKIIPDRVRGTHHGAIDLGATGVK